ncbi:hypothetical protein [Roseomonas marmotae]|uniref:Uncharacterized protein n=1 Tax=Roseomonas marmotae TaxID=2768161 RepID=A0ABS3KBM4_9PROT|nr:hypothetical protein [Roseomonas marmotae]MBO1074878.1 hypothetical protein [Roseomonas marmotae]QTI80619.1 hypothetical protein IAI58_07795 [Roseomonas marmotae]
MAPQHHAIGSAMPTLKSLSCAELDLIVGGTGLADLAAAGSAPNQPASFALAGEGADPLPAEDPAAGFGLLQVTSANSGPGRGVAVPGGTVLVPVTDFGPGEGVPFFILGEGGSDTVLV